MSSDHVEIDGRRFKVTRLPTVVPAGRDALGRRVKAGVGFKMAGGRRKAPGQSSRRGGRSMGR